MVPVMERSYIPMQTMVSARAIRETALDRQEFQTFYQEKFGLIYRYVYGKVGKREVAEDLTSEIFLKAIRGINQQRRPQSMQNWLYLVARTTVADYWRASYREQSSSLDAMLDAGWEGPAEEESAATSSRAAQRVQSLLQALPERYREVLTCRFLLNLSLNATALRLGLTVSNVKILQFRALRRAADLEQVVTATM
jgi:RNA polymerase sigma-70 factor (ECF subfamily)